LGELRITGKSIKKGGQQVGTPSQHMRVEWCEYDQTMVAIEMYVPGNYSQFAARNAAIAVIDMLLEELRFPPRDNIEDKRPS
jgi:hypothetical protein